MTDFVATCVAADCENPCGSDFLCISCVVELTTLLRELVYSVNDLGERRPGLLDDLDDTVFKLDNIRPRSSGGGSGKGHEAPMLIRLDASALKSDARNTISTWVRDFEETNPHLSGPVLSSRYPDVVGLAGAYLVEVYPTSRAMPYDTHAEAAGWMARFPGLLAQHPAADQMLDEFRDLCDRIRRMIDVAPDRTYLGPCGSMTDGVECPDDIYGLPNRATARCRTCGAEVDVDDRRGYLLKAVEDEVRTVLELSRALPKLIGREVSVDTLKGRIRRGSLGPRRKNARGHALYRVGDVIDLLIPPVEERVAA